MQATFRVELKSVQNGEVYSIHEFTIEAPTTLQAAEMFDENLTDFIIDANRVLVSDPKIKRIA